MVYLNVEKKLNYGYRTGLKKESVEYVNKLACLVDEHTVEVCFFGFVFNLSVIVE